MLPVILVAVGAYLIGDSILKDKKYAKGGKIDKSDELEYESILSVLKEKIDESIEELPSDYYMAAESFKGEEVEHKSRDGFIAYTDGGYEARWFDNINHFNGSGISLPTAGLDAEMQRQIDYNYEAARDRFKDEYPDIVEELGEDNIDYNSLQESGYDDEAEVLSEYEQDYDGDNTIMMEIGSFYYSPENSRGEDDKHTIFVFANVNLESPYHRSGNLEDGIDFTFTFNSIDELNEKIDENLKKIIEWFDGKNYKEGKKDLKITRMAKGGMMANGGKITGLEKSIEKTEKAIKYFEKEKENGNEYADYALKSLHSYLEELKEEQSGNKMAKGGETKKEYLFNFTSGGFNTIFAKDKREAVKLAKEKYKDLKVDEKSFRVKTEKDYKQLMSSFYAKGGAIAEKTTVEVGEDKITVIKNRKEKTGFAVYVQAKGYAPMTLDVYATKEAAMKKAKALAKKEGYKFVG